MSKRRSGAENLKRRKQKEQHINGRKGGGEPSSNKNAPRVLRDMEDTWNHSILIYIPVSSLCRYSCVLGYWTSCYKNKLINKYTAYLGLDYQNSLFRLLHNTFQQSLLFEIPVDAVYTSRVISSLANCWYRFWTWKIGLAIMRESASHPS